ncbi:uncharacterized protein LOC107639774 isoform X2 [Arachis ipaensis]|uniref:uncharacterized protein LOC107639774 isoform X2 n=1 Tax=Arachis ipaensis TaxID=130454 RepID=UPI0007AF7BC2|nr:uncharacterized protein LOC107639774 isoform X2 [Arachis ipaensis]
MSMAVENEKSESPITKALKLLPPPAGNENSPQKQASSPTARDRIVSVASNIASQPLHFSDPQVWGVLTAISNNARKRLQGINILLTANEHCIGRLVDDVRFQIDSNNISANHCRIYRMSVTNENMVDTTSIFLKDTSTNGTYLNWEKLKKNGPAVKVFHGDIISFAAPPQHDLTFSFVYREVLLSSPMPDNAAAKRKAERCAFESKRLKGLGIGAPEGPISLDDFRSLQRSNTELRKQLENQVVLIDTLRNDNRVAADRHESELQSAKKSVAKCYLDQLKELQQSVDLKYKELGDVNRVTAEQKHAIEDLNERLSASMQSCAEANAIISSQKVNIAELKEQLDDERTQRKDEREKATTDLKAAVFRAQSEAQEELRRHTDAALRRERELHETINKLQESERERCLLVETLRSKLEDTRQKMVVSDNKVRQLETELHEEKLTTANQTKKIEELEEETRRLSKDLESEKAAREEAWAKVSILELEINAAMRDLDFERRRLRGARERLMLRETQLRAFYSTTEEIQVLFAKQQEQLKAMQRTLEDEENYENTSVDMDGVIGGTPGREGEVAGYHSKNTAKAGSTASTQKRNRDQVETSSNEASVTEKHDCEVRSQECHNTQEFTSADHDHDVRGGFGSDIDGAAAMMDGVVGGTGCVLGTESPSNYGIKHVDLNKSGPLDGDTMQCDDDVNVQETEEQAHDNRVSHPLQLHDPTDTEKVIEDTEVGGTIRTADLLTSEVAGSWACSTAPSVHGDNESPSRDNNEGCGPLHDSNIVVAESQNTDDAAAKRNERQALRDMIGIVAPDLREKFGGSAYNCGEKQEKDGSSTDSDTQSCSNSGNEGRINAEGGAMSDEETQCCDHVEENEKQDDAMDEGDDEATQED